MGLITPDNLSPAPTGAGIPVGTDPPDPYNQGSHGMYGGQGGYGAHPPCAAISGQGPYPLQSCQQPPEQEHSSPSNYNNDEPSGDDEANVNVDERQVLASAISRSIIGSPAPMPGARRVGPNARSSLDCYTANESYFHASCIDPERPSATADSSSPSLDGNKLRLCNNNARRSNGICLMFQLVRPQLHKVQLRSSRHCRH